MLGFATLSGQWKLFRAPQSFDTSIRKSECDYINTHTQHNKDAHIPSLFLRGVGLQSLPYALRLRKCAV